MRIPTGSSVLDEVTGGGLPAKRITLIEGAAGSGKTILSLQILVQGAEAGGSNGVFVCFEESRAEIHRDAASLGWDLAALEEAGRLSIVECAPDPDLERAGGFDLQGLLAIVEAQAKKIGADLVVFDSLDVLSKLIGDPLSESQEFYRLKQWGRRLGLTCILTGRRATAAQPGSTDTDGYNFLPYLSDACITLDQQRVDNVSVRTLRVSKIRGSVGAGITLPFSIAARRIAIAPPGALEVSHQVSTERMTSGVERLDKLLGGGYFRGSGILISGAPGTAKTSLAMAFIEAVCSRGERAFLLSFDEAADQMVRNARSIGIDLERYRGNGLLRMLSLRSGAASLEEQLVRVFAELEAHRPVAVAVDPISALARAPGSLYSISPSQRLMDFAKSRGISILMTTLIDAEGDTGIISTAASISTIADTWIHLEFKSHGGERNRSLGVMKSRGTNHSHQVRELILSDRGIDLADVFTAGGEVLMGTARVEREGEMVAQEEHQRRLFAERLRDLEGERSRIEVELEKLMRLQSIRDREIEELRQAENGRRAREEARRQRVFEARRGDVSGGDGR